MARERRIWMLMYWGVHYVRGVALGILSYSGRPSRLVFFRAPVTDGPGLASIAGEIRRQKPDGILAHINEISMSKVLGRFGVPVVNTGNAFGNWPRVGVDDDAVGRMAAKQYMSQGFRNFAFMPFGEWGFSRLRCAGFAAALAEQGFSCDVFPDPPTTRRTSWARMESMTARWLLDLPKPVAIMAAEDGTGGFLTRICAERGIRVPEDVAIMGVDNDILCCQFTEPPLSSVELPLEGIGATAVALLQDLLDGKRSPPGPILLPPVRIVQRQSSDILMVDDPEVAAALRFIRQHASEPITVGHILRAIPVARRSLERGFAQRIGRSIMTDIRQVRIDLAKELLATTTLDMASIAKRCGFALAVTFCKVFRAQMKMTPTQYRQMFRAKCEST